MSNEEYSQHLSSAESAARLPPIPEAVSRDAEGQIPGSPASEQAPYAIEQLYQNLQTKCESILQDSLCGHHAHQVAESHVFLHELERWISILTPNKEKQLLAIAAQEYQYALLSLTQGLYGNAFKGLRLVLELGLQAVYLSANRVELQEWLESRKDTTWRTLLDKDNGVLSVRFANAFLPELRDDVCHYRELAERLYRECSGYVHGNMQKSIPLPQLLTFAPDTFELWHREAKNVSMIVIFSLALRYLKDMSREDAASLEHDLIDRLGHILTIRRYFGGTEGG